MKNTPLGKREKVGKIATDLLKKAELDPGLNAHSSDEQMGEMLADWDKVMADTIECGRVAYGHDFYVEVQTRKERNMKNVIRNQFFHRKSCPTPTNDQTVFKYHYVKEQPEFLWVLPSKEAAQLLTDYALEVPIEKQELLRFVLQDRDGTLLRLAKKLNGEKLHKI